MGLSASQARLLSITARLSDNEASAQALSYSKQRLADETEQVNNDYLEALDATKLQVLTGFNGSVANYTDISYSLMTGFNTVACDRQYVVTNAKGNILVTKAIKDAYEKGNGDFNVFLANVDKTTGYTQSPSNVTDDMVHEAWDKYFASVYGSAEAYYSLEHGSSSDIEFGWTENESELGGYATVKTGTSNSTPLNFNGTSTEQRELYDYAVALTKQQHEEDAETTTLKTSDEVESGLIQYYRNIFNQMATCGYYTDSDAEEKNIKDNSWFESQLKKGNLFLKYYSSTDNNFVSTTLSEDDAVQEVEDEKAIAVAEAKYTKDITNLESQDNKIDLELKKLDSEHNALQTEYDSVKSVIDKNVEKTFNMFS